ncbi:Neurexin-4 [Stylophora pistillata]|uniref:Neurexin-4 n=1 Tax=Stylophora pistillata TaxID=50429 RepID=A0A2B4R7T3_STYPI|nr:Neurexin-4 [Stylophora pistillata]
MNLQTSVNQVFLEPLEEYRLEQPLSKFPVPADSPKLHEVSELRIMKLLATLNPSKACGPDEIPNWLLKKYAELLAYPVSKIINSSFKEQRLLKIWKLADVSLLPKSPCKSAPCANGGICVPEYERNSFHCDCAPGFCGILCERRGSKTCSDIKDCHPEAKTGSFLIDPDGEGGVEPFTVYCNMTEKHGVGVTVVSHDSEKRSLVDGFEGPGSYSRNVNYNATSLLQLASLTASSAQYEQFIMYECYESVLLSFHGAMYGWWVSRDGELMKYWGGVDSVDYKCACGLTNSCADPNQGCNCDRNDQNWREDSGLLTDKSKLPVKQLRFGDTGPGDMGYHTLGKMKCFGLI